MLSLSSMELVVVMMVIVTVMVMMMVMMAAMALMVIMMNSQSQLFDPFPCLQIWSIARGLQILQGVHPDQD